MKTIVLLFLITVTAQSQDKFNGAKLKVDSTRNGITFLSDSAKNHYFKAILKDAGIYGLQDQNGDLYFVLPADLVTAENVEGFARLRQSLMSEKAFYDWQKRKKQEGSK